MNKILKSFLINISLIAFFGLLIFGVLYIASNISDERAVNDCNELEGLGFITEIKDTGFWNVGLICKVQVGDYEISLNYVKEDLIKFANQEKTE